VRIATAIGQAAGGLLPLLLFKLRVCIESNTASSNSSNNNTNNNGDSNDAIINCFTALSPMRLFDSQPPQLGEQQTCRYLSGDSGNSGCRNCVNGFMDSNSNNNKYRNDNNCMSCESDGLFQ
jgi:hypothetical protein